MNFVYKKSFPVCFLSESEILIFKNGVFFKLDLADGIISPVAKFQISMADTVLTKIPLVSRILRKGIRCGILISEKIVLFVSGKKIFELELNTRQISKGYLTSDDSRPLAFSKIERIRGFKDGVYFGGYKSNQNKDSMSIFMRVRTDKWVEVFKFQPGLINHIHNIIADPFKNLVYILTGDFDNSSGIWLAEDDFKSVTPVLTGDQKYRGCVGFPTTQGLVYATDSPFSENSIRLLRRNGADWESILLIDINGPSIYGCNWRSDFVFSTSVEGDGRDQSIWYKLFGTTRGKGISHDYSFIYKGNLNDGFKEIYKEKKDALPFYLFQFGVLVFPSGKNESPYLPVYHIATCKYGMSTILIESE